MVDERRASALLRLAGSTGIAERQLALPIERVIADRGFGARNREFLEHAAALAARAGRTALDRARLDGSRVDLIITTSCTGVAIPSLAGLLVPRLGLRTDVVRLPITELGCAAGAAALARAREHLLAFPDHVALVISVELTSLTFQRGDASMSNLVASSIFGDGAAAVVLGGPPVAPSPRILDARTHLWPGSAHLMGFDVEDSGFRIVLDRAVPAFLEGKVRPLVAALCEANGVAPEQLSFAALHPGGRRILDNLERELGLGPEVTDESRAVLREHGNMSSATVLFVLERLLRRRPSPAPGSLGLLAAFGPGFSAELALLRWEA